MLLLVEASRRKLSRLLGPLLRRCWLALPVLMVVAWSGDAHAYAWMIRHGLSKCSTCHTDPSGGEVLTHMGRVQSETRLSHQWGDGNPTNAAKLLYGLDEPNAVRLGGSYRHMTLLDLPSDGNDSKLRTFPMQLDAYGTARIADFVLGGSLGVAKVPAGSPHARAAQITTDQGDGVNLISRNHYVGFEFAPGMLLRAGRLNLPFGIRLPEHVIWARDATRTDRESDQQHGAAFAYTGGRLRGELMLIAGNYQISPDDFRERGYSGSLEYLLAPTMAVGVSSLLTRAESDRVLVTEEAHIRQAHGVNTRLTLGKPLVLLAEADALLSTDHAMGYTGLAILDYEPLTGLHFAATGEVLDRGAGEGNPSTKGAGDPLLGAWLSVNWFILTHVDARVDLVARQQDPLRIQSQLHFYF